MATIKAKLRTAMDEELHDLCQPITALWCRLELGQMMGDADSMKAAVKGSLVECRRACDGIALMRRRLDEICGEPEIDRGSSRQ